MASYFAQGHKELFPDGIIGIRVDGKDVHAVALDFVRSFDREYTEEDPREASVIMQQVFSQRKMLLIFDNASTADIHKLLPGGCCSVLFTTRNRSLPPLLGVPEMDLPVLSPQNARLLLGRFLERTPSRLDQDPAAVEQILEIVACLPLALEIAGKTLRMRPRMSLAVYAEELQAERLERLSLDNQDDPQLSVRVCFEQSLKLLRQEGRSYLIQVFARLAACAANGFSQATALAAAGLENTRKQAEQLEILVDLSLLNIFQENRYQFHPLLHEFATEQAKKDAVLPLARESHAQYCQELMRQGHPDPADLDDYILAGEWLAEQEQDYVSFYLKIKPLVEGLGRWQQAENLVRAFQQVAASKGDVKESVQLHIQEAKFRLLQGDMGKAEQSLHEAGKLLESIDDQRLQAMHLNSLGGVYQRLGEFQEAQDAFEKSYDLAVALNDQRGQAMVLNSLGGLYQRLGKFQEAGDAFKKSYEIEGALNNQRGQAMVLFSWGKALLAEGQPQQAKVKLEQSFSIDAKLKDRVGLEIVTPVLCRVMQQLGQGAAAMAVCNQALALFPKDAKLLDLKENLGQPSAPLHPGRVKFIKAGRQDGHFFGYVQMDDGIEDARLDSRHVNLSGLSAGTRVQVQLSSDRYGKPVVKEVQVVEGVEK